MIRIICDSTADFTLEESKTLGIEIVPLKTRINDQEYLDRYELSPNTFYGQVMNLMSDMIRQNIYLVRKNTYVGFLFLFIEFYRNG